MLEKATNKKAHTREAYETFKQGKELLDQGKEFKRPGFNKEGIFETLKELKEHYEPESLQAERKFY